MLVKDCLCGISLDYRFHCLLIVIISAVTLLAMFYGESYSDVLFDHAWGIRPDFSDEDVLRYLQWSWFADPFWRIYFYPIIAVCIAYSFARTRLVFIAFGLLFMCVEPFAVGGGGDIKGCEECGLSLFFYSLVFPVLYPLIMCIAFGLQFSAPCDSQ